MKTICVDTYDQILGIRSDYNYKFENAVLFRGTSNPLVPSLVEKCSFGSYSDLAYKEHMLLQEFKTYSSLTYQYQNGVPLDWEIRIAAREHGLASSLLDWSNNIDIAIEFATYNFISKNIDFTSVWILVKSDMDQLEIDGTTKQKYDDINLPTIINYNLSTNYAKYAYSRRKVVQGGFFLKQPYFTIETPLNKNLLFQDRLTKIFIPKSAINSIRNSLSETIDLNLTALPSASNNNSSEILDDICQRLNSKYA
ncbi:MAG: FRG domain-containing protein [Flavobacterium sp.]|nr:MAG: FRG domain-containing protein [Flavobacterium sp.]